MNMKFILPFIIGALALNVNAQENNENIIPAPEIGEEQAFNGRYVSQLEPSELPEMVQRMVSIGEFRKWDIREVYEIHESASQNPGEANYILVVSRRDSLFALYYNLEGRLIRQEMMTFLEEDE
jgi:hypothetical protein